MTDQPTPAASSGGTPEARLEAALEELEWLRKLVHLLAEQGDSHTLTNGLSISRRSGRAWFVYHNGTEVHWKGERSDPVPFESAMDAIAYIESPEGFEVIGPLLVAAPAPDADQQTKEQSR